MMLYRYLQGLNINTSTNSYMIVSPSQVLFAITIVVRNATSSAQYVILSTNPTQAGVVLAISESIVFDQLKMIRSTTTLTGKSGCGAGCPILR